MAFVAVFSDPTEIDDPFQWKPQENLESVPDNMIDRLTWKIEEMSLEEEIEFECIILYLALSYEHFNGGNVEKSREILRDMLKKTSELGELENGGCRSRLLALEHLLLSALTHVSVYSNDIEKAQQNFDKIPRITSMDAKSKAALSGFRATFYAEYGIYGSKAGVKFASKAVEMDAEESLWYFVKGKLFSRVRRVERPFDIPSPDELEALETAFEKESNAAYAIFMAQTYRETANRAFRKHRNDGTVYPNFKTIIDKMNHKSRELYKKSLSLKPHCPRIKFRCAKGLMSLPPPFKDTDLAKKCISDGLKIAPQSAYGNHVMAMFCERYDKDIHASIGYLKVAVSLHVYGATLDLLRLEFSSGALSKDDILPRLEHLYENFTESARRCQTLCQFVSYYLFVDYVLEKAIEYLVQVFRLNSSCDDVDNHRSLFLPLRFTISLLEVVVDDAKIVLDDENCSNDARAVCKQFLADLADLNVAYARNRPRYLRQEYLKNGDGSGRTSGGRQFQNGFGGGRGRGRGWGRGRSRGRGRGGRGGPSSTKETLSYVWRRDQQAATDQTLKKIDDFTGSWKKELEWRRRRSSPDRVPRVAQVDSGDEDNDRDSDGGASTFRPGHQLERRSPMPPKKGGSRRSPSPGGLPLAGLAISPRPSASQRSDADFDASVEAYRRAKQAADSARRSNDAQSDCGAASTSNATHSRQTDVSTSANAKPSRPKQQKKVGDDVNADDAFASYLARSTDDLMKKFQPREIDF